MKIALLLLKLVITASLCFWLFSKIDLPVLEESLTRLGAAPIIVGVLLHVAVVFLSALRWWLPLIHPHAAIPFFMAFPSYYLGVFSNNFLPRNDNSPLPPRALAATNGDLRLPHTQSRLTLQVMIQPFRPG